MIQFPSAYQSTNNFTEKIWEGLENSRVHYWTTALLMHTAARYASGQLCSGSTCKEACKHTLSSSWSHSCCGFEIVVGVHAIPDTYNSCNVIWKYLWFLLMTKSQVTLILQFIVTFIIEGNFTFHTKDNKKIKLYFSPLQIHGCWFLICKPLWQAWGWTPEKNLYFIWFTVAQGSTPKFQIRDMKKR